MFAKLYGPDDQQILVRLCEGDSGPEVRFDFQPKGLGVCSLATSFPDTEEGFLRAETFFAKVDEAMAKKLVESQMSMVQQFAPEEDPC